MSFFILIGASWVLGIWALRLLRVETPWETWAGRLVLGLALCALLVLAVGTRSLEAVRFTLYVIAVLGLGHELLWRSSRVGGERHTAALEGPLRGFDYCCMAAAVTALLLAFLKALAPETGWEATSVHLAVARDYVRTGALGPVEGSPLSPYLTPIHALLAYALYDGGEWGARLLNWSFGLLACGVVYDLGRRTGKRRAGLIAAALLATAPVLFEEAGTVSIDLACAAMVVAALSFWVAWDQEGAPGRLMAAGILLGTATAIRGPSLVPAVLLLVATPLVPRLYPWRSLCLLGAAWGMAVAPWWISVFPHAGLSGLGGFPRLETPEQLLGLTTYERTPYTSFQGFFMYPWDVVMRPQRFGSWHDTPGGLVLFLGVPAIALGGPWARRLAGFALCGGAAMFVVEQGILPLLPFLLTMMVVAALGAVRFTVARWLVATVLVLHFAFGIGLAALRVRSELPVLTWRQTPEAYRAERMPNLAAYRWLSEQAGAGRVVLSLDPRSYPLACPVHRDYAAVARLAIGNTRDHLVWLRKHGIAFVLYPRRDLDQLKKYEYSPLRHVLEAWRGDRRHFVPVSPSELAKTGLALPPGTEIYRVQLAR